MGAIVVFLAAVLAGLGVGSGGLYLLYLTEVAGLSQYAAQGANLVFFATATLASAVLGGLRGRLPRTVLLPILGVGLAGAVAGSLLTLAVPAAFARRGFGFLMLAGGASTLFSVYRERRDRRKREKEDKKV